MKTNQPNTTRTYFLFTKNGNEVKVKATYKNSKFYEKTINDSNCFYDEEKNELRVRYGKPFKAEKWGVKRQGPITSKPSDRKHPVFRDAQFYNHKCSGCGYEEDSTEEKFTGNCFCDEEHTGLYTRF